MEAMPAYRSGGQRFGGRLHFRLGDTWLAAKTITAWLIMAHHHTSAVTSATVFDPSASWIMMACQEVHFGSHGGDENSGSRRHPFSFSLLKFITRVVPRFRPCGLIFLT